MLSIKILMPLIALASSNILYVGFNDFHLKSSGALSGFDLSSSGHNRNIAAYIISLSGSSDAARRLLQTRDGPMLSLSEETIHLHAILISISREVHEIEMLFSSLFSIHMVSELILFYAADARIGSQFFDS